MCNAKLVGRLLLSPRRFWSLGIETASKTSASRFITLTEQYLNGVVSQARDREEHSIRSLEDYLQVRRSSVGIEPSFVMLELGYDLPDEVFHHPAVIELRRLAVEMITVDNVSFARYSPSVRYPSLNVRICVHTTKNRQRNSDLTTPLIS